MTPSPLRGYKSCPSLLELTWKLEACRLSAGQKVGYGFPDFGGGAQGFPYTPPPGVRLKRYQSGFNDDTDYRVTSIKRNTPLLGPYRRPMRRVLGGS